MSTKLRTIATLACVGLSAGVLAAGSACLNLGGESCTAIGCADQATVDLESTSGGWAPGMYELTADAGDGGVETCSLQIVSAPSPTNVGLGTCSGGLGLTFLANVTCQTSQNGNAVRESCTPVPGSFHLTLTIAGTPARVALTLSRDGARLLDTAVAFAYREFQPNGPRCGRGCQEASAQLTIVAEMGMDAGESTDGAAAAPCG